MPLTTRQKIQIASLASHSIRVARRLLGATDDIVQVRRNGIDWRLDLREGIDFSIYLLGAFEWRTVRACSRLIAPGHTVLDIGANIGAHTLHLARCVGARGRVYAFEPTDYAYRKLLDNIALNPSLAPNITAAQTMLVSGAASRLKPEICSSWPLAGQHDRHAQHQGALKSTVGARTMTLDLFLTEVGLSKVDFVKLDVDGHECEVLEGWTTITKYRPKIIMELAPYEEDGRTLSELLSLMSASGYEFFELGRQLLFKPSVSQALDPAVILARIRPGTSINILAMPVS